jgi:predicted adenylyl cyclase CyaB
VYYTREDKANIRPSNFMLYKTQNLEQLEKLLTAALGLLVRVRKQREIYFIDNIKFNLDIVEDLGLFLEIEAMTNDPSEIDALKEIVSKFLKIFKIDEATILSKSYSDLLLELERKRQD